MTRDWRIYARISSDDSSGTALGVKRQIADCTELIELKKKGRVVGVYVDNDVSATSGKPRPEYQRLLSEVQPGEGIATWDLDRLHRQPAELEEFIKLADRLAIELASVGGDVDLSTPQGRMVARIKGAVARAEVDHISRRVRRKQLELAEAGRVGNGGYRPYGWLTDRMTPHTFPFCTLPSREEITGGEVAVIRELAQRVLAGENLSSIARGLSRRGIPTTRGGPWSQTSVSRLLTAPRTAGLRQHQGEVIGPAVWPAILDRDTWESVRAILRNPQRRPPGMTNVRRHLLSGIAFCGACSRKLYFQRAYRDISDGYICVAPDCRGVRVAAKYLEPFVIELVLTKLEREHVRPYTASREDQTAQQLEAKIQTLTARRQEIAEEFADDPDIGKDQLRAMTRRLNEQIAGLKARLASNRTDDAWSSVLGGKDPADLRRTWDALPLAQRRGIIAKVTSNTLTVYPAARRGGRGFDPGRVDVLAWRRDGGDNNQRSSATSSGENGGATASSS